MSRKSTLSALFAAKPVGASQAPSSALEVKSQASSEDGELGAPNNAAPVRIRSGAIGAMGTSLQVLQEAAREADHLRETLASSDVILDIDPTLIDASSIADRLNQTQDADFDALKASILESGQQVPVLLRPHPATPGRYQTAFGHRRIRALKEIGRPVRAQVKTLTDVELVLAQGKENAERRDLSYIEKAYFAANLAAHGIERSVMMTALNIDKSDLSRLLSIGRAIPAHILQAIGPATKIGRPRWEELIEALKQDGADDRCRTLVIKDAFSRSSSDERFKLMLSTARGFPIAQSPKKGEHAVLLKDTGGRTVVTSVKSGKSTRFEIDETSAPDFAQFLAEQLKDLYAAYRFGRPL
jgi:ParB family transcriptional regulator, chromosome partitioning protein